MFAKLLGILDAITAILFFLNSILDKSDSWIPNKLLLIFAIYLLVKAIIFLLYFDFASVIDLICSIIILASLAFSMPVLIVIIVVLFLLQKSFFSIIS